MSIFQSKIQSLADFHNTFRIGKKDNPVALTHEESLLRYALMREENEEYLEAALKGDLAKIADVLGDQVYILLGTILRHGLHFKIEEIFLQNTSKQHG